MINPDVFTFKPDMNLITGYTVTIEAFVITFILPLGIAACVQCELLWHKHTDLSLGISIVSIVAYMLVGAPLLACAGLPDVLAFVIHIMAPTVVSLLTFATCKLMERMSNELYRTICTLLHKSND